MKLFLFFQIFSFLFPFCKSSVPRLSTLAGKTSGLTNGIGTNAKFNVPSKADLSPDGKSVYIADTNSNQIRQINLATSSVITVVGSTSGSLNQPLSINKLFFLSTSVTIWDDKLWQSHDFILYGFNCNKSQLFGTLMWHLIEASWWSIAVFCSSSDCIAVFFDRSNFFSQREWIYFLRVRRVRSIMFAYY